ncbi:hypothetical protein [Flavobacterium sp. Arc2]|uniref:hypothetical protein n=1 Tax=Flavobacterium sp. Arc2 TaxID=3046685 RepID=UPI00352D6323
MMWLFLVFNDNEPHEGVRAVAVIYQNKARIENNYEVYRRRQAIVEHPYGVIKRQWGFCYIMTKKNIKHASANVGLILTAYNLRRICNLIDPNLLKQYLKLLRLYFTVSSTYFKLFYGLLFFQTVNVFIIKK